MSKLPLYRKILAQANWQKHAEALSPCQLNWLLHQGSLTEKLLAHYQTLEVKVLNETWIREEDESSIFLPPFWLREVMLVADGEPCIFAQTRVPEKTVKEAAREILQLGTMPIGMWLFVRNPQRQTLEWSKDEVTGLYSRCSVLLIEGYPIEIKELFLPNFSFELKPKCG